MGRTGEEMERLQQVMKRLLAPGGCPWDREQTHESLVRYMIEETYEAIDAIEHHDMVNLKEELGDVLLQVVFHANLCEQEGHFDLADVMDAESRKMIQRHPHVFGEQPQLDTGEQVLQIWESMKKKEHLLDGIPKGLPALLRAHKMQEKAARVGFDWEDVSGAWDKLYEELEELKTASTEERRAEEMGDVFFALVNVARMSGMEAEEILQKANEKFERRFNSVEQQVKASGKDWEDFRLPDLDHFWDEAKRQEKAPKEEA